MNDVKDLLVQELVLTKIEVQANLRQAKTAAITLGIGIGVVAIGGMLLMLMLVQVLAAYTAIPLWGCYGIVGGVLVVLAGVLLAIGKRQAEAIDVVPQRRLETIIERGLGASGVVSHSSAHHSSRPRCLVQGAMEAPAENAGPGRQRQHAKLGERGVRIPAFVLLLFSLTR